MGRRSRALYLIVTLFGLSVAPGRHARGLVGAQDFCATSYPNPIPCENSLPGNPASEWDVSGAGSSSIQGFSNEISVDHGQTIRFKISTPATAYRLDIYRLGYYGGLGARKIATVLPSAALPQSQPACVLASSTGLVDCGVWHESASWPVPATAVSGIYVAKLVRTDGVSGSSHVVFVVRDDDGESDLLFQTSDTTWQAYNQYGGNSLYIGGPGTNPGRAYKVSYNRPVTLRGTNPEDWVFNAEYPMVRWLEANGYNVSYSTDVDSDRRGAEILEHKVFMSVGHDEYWSAGQRANVETARNSGVHLAFFSGNAVYWKTRWESSIDGSGTAHRTLVSFKESLANAKIDPLPDVWTGLWRDDRFSPPADVVGVPENALMGTSWAVQCCTYAIAVPELYGKARFWRNTSVATLAPGATATLSANTLGYEWDEEVDNGFRPAGLARLSSTTVSVPERLNYNVIGPGTATHALTLYRAPSGALVFGGGTVQWSWGLDGTHDRGGSTPDVRIRQATVNLLADMGVQPATLQAGLVPAAASTDATPPVTSIASPAAGATVTIGASLTISGTATDAGGQIVAVEVSVDGGATWKLASGRSSWTYAWAPGQSGTITIMSRAVDDSANLESPGATRTITATSGGGGGGTGGLVAAYGFEEGAGTTAADSSGTGNFGTLSGPTWTTSGKFGKALSFDGVNDWVTTADASPLDLTTGLTIEAWVRPSATSSWRTVVMKERTGDLVYALYSHDTVRPSAWLYVPAKAELSAGSALSVNAWTHLAMTYNGTTLRSYANGVQVGSLAASGSIVTSAGALRIGGNAIWGEFFAGLIDEVRIYSRALSGAEIAADMATPIVPVGPSDTTPPTVVAVTPPSGAIGQDVATNVVATFSEALTASTVNATTCEIRDAGQAVVSATVTYDAATLTVTLNPAVSLNAGTTYTVNLLGGAADPRVKDAAGNALAATVSWTFSTAAALPPPLETQLTTKPPALTSSTGATFAFSANRPGATFECSLDGSAFGSCTSPVSYDTLGSGAHSFRVRALDGAEVDTTPAVHAWTVDTTPPTITAVAAVPASATAAITWTTTEGASSRVDYGTSPSSLTSSASSATVSTAHSMTLTGLTGATVYYYRVSSADGAGNVGVSPPAASAPATFTTSGQVFPAATVVQTGSLRSGGASSLASDNNSYYQVNSTASGTRTTSWYAALTVPNEATSILITYKGKNSKSATQTMSAWNWTTSAWVQLDSRTVGTTEVLIAGLVPPGALADYVSGTSGAGEFRVRVRSTGSGTSTFISQGDLMRIDYAR